MSTGGTIITVLTVIGFITVLEMVGKAAARVYGWAKQNKCWLRHRWDVPNGLEYDVRVSSLGSKFAVINSKGRLRNCTRCPRREVNVP